MDVMFLSLAASKHCPPEDASVQSLKHRFTLPELYNLKMFIDIRESTEQAYYKDNPVDSPNKK